jgi:hypothetical protein
MIVPFIFSPIAAANFRAHTSEGEPAGTGTTQRITREG